MLLIFSPVYYDTANSLSPLSPSKYPCRTPYVITQFFYTCHQGQYVLLLFLLVEASTMPLNAMAFLEDLGRRRTPEHR